MQTSSRQCIFHGRHRNQEGRTYTKILVYGAMDELLNEGNPVVWGKSASIATQRTTQVANMFIQYLISRMLKNPAKSMRMV